MFRRSAPAQIKVRFWFQLLPFTLKGPFKIPISSVMFLAMGAMMVWPETCLMSPFSAEEAQNGRQLDLVNVRCNMRTSHSCHLIHYAATKSFPQIAKVFHSDMQRPSVVFLTEAWVRGRIGISPIRSCEWGSNCICVRLRLIELLHFDRFWWTERKQNQSPNFFFRPLFTSVRR